MGFVSDVKKALGIGEGGKAKQINKATIGNPGGVKKTKLKPLSSKVPTTLRG